MSVRLNYIPKNRWQNLFFSYKINILAIVIIIFIMQKSARINCLNEAPALEVDVLTPLKPTKEYAKFASYFESLPTIPDYKFQIDNISHLIQQQSELLGHEFPLPTFHCSAQIKCSVQYDEFQLFIRFLDPPNHGRKFKFEELPVITISIANYGNPRDFNENLRFVFPADWELLYGTFYPISSISYDAQIKNKIVTIDNSPIRNHVISNYLVVNLTLQIGISENLFLEDGVFLWKVDVSGEKVSRRGGHPHEYQLAMSPFVFKDHNGFRVQLRLFLKDVDCYVEMRFFHVADSVEELRLNISIVHPTDPTKRIILPFADFSKSNNQKSSVILNLATIRELRNFFEKNYLLVALEIQ